MTPELAEKLKYGSKLHGKIVDALRKRLRMSEQAMKDRYAQMAKNEETFQAYIPERDVDALRRQNRDTGGVPEYRTIEIPHAYATLMTAHTYYTSVFLARSPVFQITGRHGEPETSRVGMETLLNYQLQVGEGLMPLFIWLLDPGKYGYGVIMHHWDKEIARVRKDVQEPVSMFGFPIPGRMKTVSRVIQEIGYEGNRLRNVRAQDFFPDPRVALVHFQRGEFCSRYVETAWMEIYAGSRSEAPRYINFETMRKMRSERTPGSQQTGAIERDKGSENVTTLPDQNEVEGAYDVPVGFVKGHEIYIKLVPSDWQLAVEKDYEIWAFNVSTNGVIFGAEPLGELANRFPFDLLLDEVDGYTLFPRSTIERVKPLNDVMTWLINTHFYNVRAALNNQIIVDPSKVVMKDLENPGPGKIIRLKPEAYGQDVRAILTQLQVVDITKGHIGQDLMTMIDFVARMTGTNDNIMGMINAGGRKTATEVRTSSSFGVNRLKTMCEWHSTVGFGPLTQKLIQRTQQNYSMDKQFRLVGDLAQFTTQFLKVTPADIAGFYDYEPVDGTLPVDRFAQANLWQMLLGQIAQQPAILMQYDLAKIFAWVATLAGIKNITQFKIIDQAVLQQQMQAGNVVPLKTAMKDAGRGPQPPMVGASG